MSDFLDPSSGTQSGGSIQFKLPKARAKELAAFVRELAQRQDLPKDVRERALKLAQDMPFAFPAAEPVH